LGRNDLLFCGKGNRAFEGGEPQITGLKKMVKNAKQRAAERRRYLEILLLATLLFGKVSITANKRAKDSARKRVL